jgi:Sulfotransferase domain
MVLVIKASATLAPDGARGADGPVRRAGVARDCIAGRLRRVAMTPQFGLGRAMPVADRRTDVIIAGVNKAGTTSLFVSLSTHPDVAASSIKETRYFLPARYDELLAPESVWEGYFAGGGDRPVRLEATPSYFYGAARVAEAMRARLVNPHVLLVLREPVSRAISFFTYQKVRLRFPADYPIEEYLVAADRLTDAELLDPDNERYMAFRGGCYADYLPGWLDTLGAEHVRVLDFGRLVADQADTLRKTAEWIGLDPAAFPADALSSENRTTGFKSKGFQRVALAGNDRLERLLRRHPEAKRKLRAFYYRLNGRSADEVVPGRVKADLAARYAAPNARLARQLDDAGLERPAWLDDATGQTSTGERA